MGVCFKGVTGALAGLVWCSYVQSGHDMQTQRTGRSDGPRTGDGHAIEASRRYLERGVTKKRVDEENEGGEGGREWKLGIEREEGTDPGGGQSLPISHSERAAYLKGGGRPGVNQMDADCAD